MLACMHHQVVDLFLSMPHARPLKTGTSLFPSWLPDSCHGALMHFTKIKRGSALKVRGAWCVVPDA